MIRALCSSIVLVGLSCAASAQPAMLDETRDRVLVIQQTRGHLAPGVQPKCFPSYMDETVSRAFFRCPNEAPNGRRDLPTVRSFWGLIGQN